MRRVIALYYSSVGKKVLMAVSGLVWVGFVIAHMIGNLKVFQGPEKIDAYAEFLREVGAPAFGHGELLWIGRAIMIVAFLTHTLLAYQTTRLSQQARPVSYRRKPHMEMALASRTMRWGGVFLLLFVVYHLMHFTFGNAHPDFQPGGVHHNLVTAFQSVPIAFVYIAAVIALGFHLYHGVWSIFQTLGVNHPRYNRIRRPLAALIALAVTVGFVSVPVGVLTGVIS